jgi:DNA modification methylase
MKGKLSQPNIEDLVSRYLPTVVLDNEEKIKRALPPLAKDGKATQAIESALRQVPTLHRFYHQDARDLNELADASVQLVLTSPPYWTLKHYNASDDQLGFIQDYEEFLDELDKVWRHCHRLLVEGGRMIVVVGDVCLSRRGHGRHSVVPLHASIQERCRQLGFDNLAPIIWYKIANATHETNNGSSFLGKPYEPNAIVKNDIEYILMQRKPGGYRSPSPAMRVLSLISEENHRTWFQQIWRLPGASTRHHPAPFPLELAVRLIRMFSFVGDMVFDPFAGTGTTNVAAAMSGRNSICAEVDRQYFDYAIRRFENECVEVFGNAKIDIHAD